MTQTMKKIALSMVIAGIVGSMTAQQVSTLFFLENAPMRHTVNPAFQPVSEGYLNFTPLGYTSMWSGNNSLTMSDLIFDMDGTTVTALHPNADRNQLLKQFRKVSLTGNDMSIDLLSFGFRHKENGYVHIGIMERVESGVGLSNNYFKFLLGGGMKDLTGVNRIDLTNTSMRMSAYTEIAGGYSYCINDEWTVGGKLKVLLGQANATMLFKQLTIDASAAEWQLTGEGHLQASAPLRWDVMPDQLSIQSAQEINWNQLTNGLTAMDYIKPQGYGLGMDVGFTYKPHPQVQISAALNDFGFIWWKGIDYALQVDSAFQGAGNLKYSDYSNAGNNYQFDSQKLGDDVVNALNDFGKCLRTAGRTNSYTRMLSTKLNVGVDANFCNNKLGVGILSRTRMFNQRLYEEITIGGAVRPCKWFNFALSYSLVNNGKFSNIGAGLSLMPYDGINLTLAMDYIPTCYAPIDGKYILPYQSKGMNVAMGFSIVWGTNGKKVRAKKEKKVEVVDYQPDIAIIDMPSDVDTQLEVSDMEDDETMKIVLVAPLLPIERDESLVVKEKTHEGIKVKEEVKNEDVSASTSAVVVDPSDTTPITPSSIMAPEHQVRLTKFLRGVDFETGKSSIKKTSYPALDQIAQLFKANPQYRIEVQGHTDNTGSYKRNLQLSQERANVVMNYLLKAGVPANQITAKGYADTRPIYTNRTEKGRAYNRRVAFLITIQQ